MKKLEWKKVQDGIKKRIWWLILWGLVFGWAGCWLYSEHQLSKIYTNIHNPYVVFTYDEQWEGKEAIQEKLETDFLDELAQITLAHRQDAFYNLSRGSYYVWNNGDHGEYFSLNYDESIPFKIAYFYKSWMLPFGKSVWKKEANTRYLDVLSIKEEEGNHYSVDISEKDMREVEKNKAAILKGEIKLRPKNFDEVPYNTLTPGNFYTYLKEEGKEEQGYTYLYIKKGYKVDAEESPSFNLSFRYDVSSDGMSTWSQMSEPRISPYKSKGQLVLHEVPELKKSIQNRQVTSSKDQSAEFIVTEMTEYPDIFSKNKPKFYKAYSDEWLEAMMDPTREIKHVYEVSLDTSDYDTDERIHKFAMKSSDCGRNALRNVEKEMIKDVEKNGHSSTYLTNSKNPSYDSLVIDFGDGVKNLPKDK